MWGALIRLYHCCSNSRPLVPPERHTSRFTASRSLEVTRKRTRLCLVAWMSPVLNLPSIYWTAKNIGRQEMTQGFRPWFGFKVPQVIALVIMMLLISALFSPFVHWTALDSGRSKYEIQILNHSSVLSTGKKCKFGMKKLWSSNLDLGTTGFTLTALEL